MTSYARAQWKPGERPKCNRGHAKGLPYPDCCDHDVPTKDAKDMTVDELLACFPEFLDEVE